MIEKLKFLLTKLFQKKIRILFGSSDFLLYLCSIKLFTIKHYSYGASQ